MSQTLLSPKSLFHFMSSNEKREKASLAAVNCGKVFCAGFDLSTYVGGSRMRLYSGLKSIVSVTYVIVLLIIIVNFNVIDGILREMDVSGEENLEITTAINNSESLSTDDIFNNGSILLLMNGREQYHVALWITFALCLFHGIACGVMILTSCFAETRPACVRFAQIAWWLSFTAGALIIVLSFSIYALLLPRAVQSTFDELSARAQRNYETILPLQERFNCCSVDYRPDLSNPEKIKRFEPVNVNFSCAMRSTFMMDKLSQSDNAWVVLKSHQPQKESCTELVLSYFPGRTRWTWILIAAAIPHTAFGWLFFFNCFFIACVWYERWQHGEMTLPTAAELSESKRVELEHEHNECIRNNQSCPLDEKTLMMFYNDPRSGIAVNQLSIPKLSNNAHKPLQGILKQKPKNAQQLDSKSKTRSDSHNSTTESEASPNKPPPSADNKPLQRLQQPPIELQRQHSLPDVIEDSRESIDDDNEENRHLLPNLKRVRSLPKSYPHRKRQLQPYRMQLRQDDSMSVVAEEVKSPTSPSPSGSNDRLSESDIAITE